MSLKNPLCNNQLYGHEKARSLILRSICQNKLHYAWLFHGSKGIGKATLAYNFAKLLLTAKEGQRPTKFGSHDNQDPAIRQIEKSIHPDFLSVSSETTPSLEEKKSNTITIEEIRGITRFLNSTPVMGKYRAVVIDAIENMSYSAANALLKTLEEPNKNNILILICHSPAMVPITIRSRCLAVRLAKVAIADFSKILEQVKGPISDDSLHSLYELTNGNADLALKIIENDAFHIFEEISSALEKRSTKSVQLAIEFASRSKVCWEIIQYALLRVLFDKIKQYALSSCRQVSIFEKKVEFLEKVRKGLLSCESIHLDKNHVLMSILA